MRLVFIEFHHIEYKDIILLIFNSVIWTYGSLENTKLMTAYIIMLKLFSLALFFFLDWCKIGIGICYDLRFFELAQLYALKGTY